MGSNMVPCSRSKMQNKTRIDNMVPCTLLGKRSNKVLEVKGEYEFDFKVDFFSSMIDHLLLTEILIRLPVDSVCRCKLVCKDWCSLLSTPYFVNRVSNQRFFTLVFQYSVRGPGGYPNILYPVGAISNHPVLSRSLTNQPVDLNFRKRDRGEDFKDSKLDSEPIRAVASCHDLLLCSHFGVFYVINLLTKCWIFVPYPPTRTQDIELTHLRLFLFPKAGLLCSHDQRDITNGEFKVILLPAVRKHFMSDPTPVAVFPPEIYASQFSVRIYSSKSGQWVDIDVDWYPLSLNVYLCFTPILFHDGMLHWLNGRSLVSLDAHINLCHSVDLPKELSLERPCGFGVCQGRFRVARLIFEKAEGNILLVWDLEDYQKGVWQLAHRVLFRQTSLNNRDCVHSEFSLVGFHPYNGDIVFVDLKGGVYQFNLRTGVLESYYVLKLEKGLYNRTLQGSAPSSVLLHQGFPSAVCPRHEIRRPM